jgi:hypothetical protein
MRFRRDFALPRGAFSTLDVATNHIGIFSLT